MFKIERVNTTHKDFVKLIHRLDNELNFRYGIVQSTLKEFNGVENIQTAVLGYAGDKPIACGCFKEFDSKSIEIKRTYAIEEYRGSGIAQLVLTELEKWGAEIGFNKSVLETGIKQPDAIKFYSKLGYGVIDNYGQYIDNLNSVCMMKDI